MRLFNETDATNDGIVTMEEIAQAESSGKIPDDVVQIAAQDDNGILTLAEWLTAWETSAQVLRYEIEQFRDGALPSNADGGHFALPVQMTASQRARIPAICENLGVGFVERGVGSTRTMLVTKDLKEAEKMRAEEQIRFGGGQGTTETASATVSEDEEGVDGVGVEQTASATMSEGEEGVNGVGGKESVLESEKSTSMVDE